MCWAGGTAAHAQSDLECYTLGCINSAGHSFSSLETAGGSQSPTALPWAVLAPRLKLCPQKGCPQEGTMLRGDLRDSTAGAERGAGTALGAGELCGPSGVGKGAQHRCSGERLCALRLSSRRFLPRPSTHPSKGAANCLSFLLQKPPLRQRPVQAKRDLFFPLGAFDRNFE